MRHAPHNDRFSAGDFDDKGCKADRSHQSEMIERWIEQANFENRVRSVVSTLRPHRFERLAGWREYRARAHGLRVTISWDPRSVGAPPMDDPTGLSVPRMAEVLETILVGSAQRQDDLHAEEEFALYSRVVRELAERLNELRSRYD